MGRISAVIFDMDGLMLDTLPIYRIILQRSVEELGYTIDQDFYKKVIGLNDNDFNEYIFSELGNEFPVAKFHHIWKNKLHCHVQTYGIPKKPGLDQIIEYLVNLGIPIAIASSSNLDVIISNLNAANIHTPFNCIVSGDDVKKGKPDPEIFELAAMRLGIPSFNCIVLEDSDIGIAAATAAGMFAIMVPDKNNIPSHRELSDSVVLTNLAEAQLYLSKLLE